MERALFRRHFWGWPNRTWGSDALETGLEDKKGLGGSWDCLGTGLRTIGWSMRAACSGREPLRPRSPHR